MADSEIGVVRLVGGTALTPHQLIRDMSLAISNGRIVSLSGRVPISGGDVPSHEETPSLPQTRAGQDTLPSQEPHGGFNESITIDTKGMTILPGLINIHDHLLGTWHSKIGGGPYPNVYRWLKAVEYHPLRIECKKNTEEDIYLLGAYKNLFSGVTTVLDHYIRYDPDFYQALPLRVIHEFGRTWTLREETGWGGTIEEEFSRTNGRQPYVIHIAEGVDGEARSELAALERRGVLARNTVLVHAIALSDQEIELIAQRGATVAWCPASNIFLYGATANLPELLSSGVNVAIGTDSSWSGSANLLEEILYARRCAEEVFGLPLDARTILSMVTTNAATGLQRSGEIGALAPGYLADILVLEGEESDPYQRAVRANPEDIDLLLLEGRPVLGSIRHEDIASARLSSFSRVKVNGREKFVAGDPIALRERMWEVSGTVKRFPFLPIARAE